MIPFWSCNMKRELTMLSVCTNHKAMSGRKLVWGTDELCGGKDEVVAPHEEKRRRHMCGRRVTACAQQMRAS